MTDTTQSALDALEVTQADRMLIEAIINDYHTTRLAGSDYVTHILGKPRTQRAFARHRIAAIAAAEARGRAAERADVVWWLRMLAVMRAMQNPSQLADAIERGEHLAKESGQ
jgi:hypothetical protein